MQHFRNQHGTISELPFQNFIAQFSYNNANEIAEWIKTTFRNYFPYLL